MPHCLRPLSMLIFNEGHQVSGIPILEEELDIPRGGLEYVAPTDTPAFVAQLCLGCCWAEQEGTC